MKKSFELPKATLERITAEAQEDRQIVEACKSEIAAAIGAGVPVVRIHEGLAMAGFRGSRGVLADMLEEAGLRQKQLRGDDRIAMLREALATKTETPEPAPLPIKAEITPPAATPKPPALPEAPATPAPRTRRTRASLLAEARTRTKAAIIETATKTARLNFADQKANLAAQGKTLEDAEAQAIAQAIMAALAQNIETRASRPRPRHTQKGTIRARAEKRAARQVAIKARAEESARHAAEEATKREAALAAQAQKEADAQTHARAMLDRLTAMEKTLKALTTQIETQIATQAKTTQAMITALTDIANAQTTLAAQTQKEADSQTARLAALEARLFPPEPPAPTPTPRPLKDRYMNRKIKTLIQPRHKK